MSDLTDFAVRQIAELAKKIALKVENAERQLSLKEAELTMAKNTITFLRNRCDALEHRLADANTSAAVSLGSTQ